MTAITAAVIAAITAAVMAAITAAVMAAITGADRRASLWLALQVTRQALYFQDCGSTEMP